MYIIIICIWLAYTIRLHKKKRRSIRSGDYKYKLANESLLFYFRIYAGITIRFVVRTSIDHAKLHSVR